MPKTPKHSVRARILELVEEKKLFKTFHAEYQFLPPVCPACGNDDLQEELAQKENENTIHTFKKIQCTACPWNITAKSFDVVAKAKPAKPAPKYDASYPQQEICFSCNKPIEPGQACEHSPPGGDGEPTHDTCCKENKTRLMKDVEAAELEAAQKRTAAQIQLLSKKTQELEQSLAQKDAAALRKLKA